MSDQIELQVHLAFDEEANVWYVAKSDVPGLSLEADTPQELIQRVMDCAPEMIELNHGVMTEVVGARQVERAPARRAKSDRKPRLSVLPVFDNPLQLACA